MPIPNSFYQDLDFLNRVTQTVVLEGNEPGRVVVAPDYQCRTMTSSTGHRSHQSPGWINYRQIETGTAAGEPSLFGGEDRIWLAPEGSPFSLFFTRGEKMELASWRVPNTLEHLPFEIDQLSPAHIEMSCETSIENYFGTRFEFQLSRTIQWHARAETESALGITIPGGVFHVAHSSSNTMINTGNQAWSPDNGLPAFWILGMFKPSAGTTAVIPYLPGPTDKNNPVITTDYFGTPDPDRFRIDVDRNLIYFLGDGRFRSKIGVSWPHARNLLGSWNSRDGLLTIVQFDLPENVGAGYVNNLWRTDLDPFGGDVVNAYNDGPNEKEGMLGPFYELESLSPALDLADGESRTHLHRTIHFEGKVELLDEISEALFGVSTAEIAKVFG